MHKKVKNVEIWDLYDENKQKTDIKHIRGNVIPDGFYHLVVNAWVKNSKGEFLITQRAANRPTFPNVYECVTGSVLSGEDGLDGSIRELKEEVGLDFERKDGTIVFSKIRKEVNGKPYNDILEVWLFEYDGEIDLKTATTDEVQKAVWLSKSEIKKLFDKKKLMQDNSYIFDLDI